MYNTLFKKFPFVRKIIDKYEIKNELYKQSKKDETLLMYRKFLKLIPNLPMRKLE